MSTETEPLFDSAHRALRFAMNYTSAMPRPMMNKTMEVGMRLKQIELADGTSIQIVESTRRLKPADLKKLDGAGTAGYVLRRLVGLPDIQQLILMARSTMPTVPCACRAPCCSGHRPNPAWIRAVDRICHHLEVDAALSRIKGKKGLSTIPQMRRALVIKFLTPNQRDITLVEIAKKYDITEQTALAHKKPINAYLAKHEALAWRAFDDIMDVSGFIGFLE